MASYVCVNFGIWLVLFLWQIMLVTEYWDGCNLPSTKSDGVWRVKAKEASSCGMVQSAANKI